MHLLDCLLPKLWCANQMCGPTLDPNDRVTRFDFSCLACRLRRRWYGKYKIPQHYLKYTYRSVVDVMIADAYQAPNGLILMAENGGKIKVTRHIHVLIDPGRFLVMRLSIIRVLDQIIGLTKHRKPFVEFAEFFANYPR
jgi:hypothetical protein